MAEKADFEQEITIKSIRQSGDLKNKIISYLDDVIITQGSLVIRADMVQVLKKAGTNDDIYIAKGKPATFEQRLEDGTPIKLQADEITYQANEHTIIISGNARLSQEGSEVSGSKIIYNTLTERLEAESYSNDTVTTVLKPKTKAKE
ncbi:lipopolysaccharide transport periplasmic protein LptA [Thalassotalea sp. PLHSN55]|uniref:lipopolysaccharide transport periplasmic protein LptA n=1 Tax=Thalassotalea sp. PLHSN55 TaxID=3435888 RepID=UPI003F85C957